MSFRSFDDYLNSLNNGSLQTPNGRQHIKNKYFPLKNMSEKDIYERYGVQMPTTPFRRQTVVVQTRPPPPPQQIIMSSCANERDLMLLKNTVSEMLNIIKSLQVDQQQPQQSKQPLVVQPRGPTEQQKLLGTVRTLCSKRLIERMKNWLNKCTSNSASALKQHTAKIFGCITDPTRKKEFVQLYNTIVADIKKCGNVDVVLPGFHIVWSALVHILTKENDASQIEQFTNIVLERLPVDVENLQKPDLTNLTKEQYDVLTKSERESTTVGVLKSNVKEFVGKHKGKIGILAVVSGLAALNYVYGGSAYLSMVLKLYFNTPQTPTGWYDKFASILSRVPKELEGFVKSDQNWGEWYGWATALVGVGLSVAGMRGGKQHKKQKRHKMRGGGFFDSVTSWTKWIMGEDAGQLEQLEPGKHDDNSVFHKVMKNEEVDPNDFKTLLKTYSDLDTTFATECDTLINVAGENEKDIRNTIGKTLNSDSLKDVFVANTLEYALSKNITYEQYQKLLENDKLNTPQIYSPDDTSTLNGVDEDEDEDENEDKDEDKTVMPVGSIDDIIGSESWESAVEVSRSPSEVSRSPSEDTSSSSSRSRSSEVSRSSFDFFNEQLRQ